MYRISDEIAIISTVDYITPPVDDPRWFGRIAAANALSDVYAMGGKPLTALNLVMFPADKLPLEQLEEILLGSGEKVAEAGVSLAGGHSVDSLEPMFGLSVTGTVHPDRIWQNKGAREGDALVLTKPLGTGVLLNAFRSGKLSPHELEPTLHTMAALNNRAMETALEFEIHACTDITGFGIAGHVLEMIKASGVAVDISFEKLPLYPHAVEMYRKGETTRSNRPNRELMQGFMQIQASLADEQKEILFDPQTSGGLLFALPEEQAERLLQSLLNAGVNDSAIIGSITGSAQPVIKIL